MDTVPMRKSTFDTFRRLVYDKAGIHINDNKVALVAARVGKRMRELWIETPETYLGYLFDDESGGELVHLLDAISTNVTGFFREPTHFEVLGELLDGWLGTGQKRFRFWSAASSTGEEPYSMAMTIIEKCSQTNADIRILATDLSTRVLAAAVEGVYQRERTAPIPQPMLRRYFDERTGDQGKFYEAKREMKDLLTFSRLNLAKPPFPMSGPFDAVFCRNVMIYFDNAVRKKLLEEIFRLLKPGGYLFVGHAESLTGILSGLKSVRPSVYCKSTHIPAARP